MPTRREALTAAALLGLTAGACTRASQGRGRDVVAAGQPAALLIWAVARERLIGWPHKPDPECLTGLPAEAATLPEIGALAGPKADATPARIAALRPALIIDYGDAGPAEAALGEQLADQIHAPWHLIDGRLENTPAAFRQAGALLGEAGRGEALAGEAERVLDHWRALTGGPSFYYAKGDDGLRTGFRGSLTTEVLEGAGWTNVATGGQGVGAASMDQVHDWDPEVLVTLSPAFAERARTSGAWRYRRNGTLRRILLMPDRPFGWVDRPPSVNRLLGCAWLAGPEKGSMALAMLDRRLYGMAPTESARPRWII